MEVRCVIDFPLSQTALDLWQHLQVFQYMYDFYIARTAHMSYNNRTLGEERQGFPDLWCWGHALAIGVAIAMIGPFYWLSGFYISHIGYNPVYRSNVQLWLQFNETQIYTDTINLSNSFHAGNQSQSLRVYLNESPIMFTAT